MGSEDMMYGKLAAQRLAQSGERAFQIATARTAAGFSRSPGIGIGYDPRVEGISNQVAKLYALITTHIRTPHQTIVNESADVRGLREEVSGLRSELDEAKKEISLLRAEVAGPRQDITIPQLEPTPSPRLGLGRPVFGSLGSGTMRLGRPTVGTLTEPTYEVIDAKPVERIDFAELDKSDDPGKWLIYAGVQAGFMRKVPISLVKAHIDKNAEPPRQTLPAFSFDPPSVPSQINLSGSEGYDRLTASFKSSGDAVEIWFSKGTSYVGELLGVGIGYEDGRFQFELSILQDPNDKQKNPLALMTLHTPNLSAEATTQIEKFAEIKNLFLPIKAWDTTQLEGDFVSELLTEKVLQEKNDPAKRSAWYKLLEKTKPISSLFGNNQPDTLSATARFIISNALA